MCCSKQPGLVRSWRHSFLHSQCAECAGVGRLGVLVLLVRELFVGWSE
jgi:hypothetical protein